MFKYDESYINKFADPHMDANGDLYLCGLVLRNKRYCIGNILKDNKNKIIENINYYLDILEEDETQGLIKEAWKSIMKILNSIKPKVFRMNAIVGFDMPDTTGRVYGYYCMLIPWLSDDIYIEPDFEQKIINGEIYCKGKIRMLTIVVNLLRIVFDKRLKPLLKKIKNGGK